MTSTITTGRLVDGEATRELRESYATVVSSNRDSVRASWRFGQRLDSYSDQYTRAQLAAAIGLSVTTIARYARLYRSYQRPELAEDAARQLETYNIDLITELSRPVHARPVNGRKFRYRCTHCSSFEIAREEITDPAELAELRGWKQQWPGERNSPELPQVSKGKYHAVAEATCGEETTENGMATVTRDDQGPVRRPASGVMIDPHQLTWWRERNGWSRQDLADRVARLYLDGHPDALPFTHRDGEPADGHPPWPERRMSSPVRLCAVCGAPVSGGLTRDAIAKNENPDPDQRRRPKPANLRALIAALSYYGEPVRPAGLLPGSPRAQRAPEALDRDARLERNQRLREFAMAIGRPELAWNRRGRARYTVELETLYDEYLGNQAAREGGQFILAQRTMAS